MPKVLAAGAAGGILAYVAFKAGGAEVALHILAMGVIALALEGRKK